MSLKAGRVGVHPHQVDEFGEIITVYSKEETDEKFETIEDAIKTLLPVGILSATDDLDNVRKSGIYGSPFSPAHSPESLSYFTLLVNNFTGGSITQTVFKRDAIYCRTFMGSPQSWSAWYKYTGTIVT